MIPIESQIILNSINDGIFAVDLDFKVIAFNNAAEKITGKFFKNIKGNYCKKVFNSTACNSLCFLKKTIESGEKLSNKLLWIQNDKKAFIPVKISTAVLKNNINQTIGGVVIFTDISETENIRKNEIKRSIFQNIISKNNNIQKIFKKLPNIADSNSSVLIEGEFGTGKELFAKAIHDLSFRKHHRFIVVNCSLLSSHLLEAELFGNKSNPLKKSNSDKVGKFQLGNNGTIFLKEISEISPELQAKLLRFMQYGIFEQVGGIESIKSNIRIIASDSNNLFELCEKNIFCKDLFYQLNIANIKLPPLRERKDDIPLLIENIINKLRFIHGKDIISLNKDAMQFLLTYDYPGNIIELENIIEKAFINCESDKITCKDLKFLKFNQNCISENSKALMNPNSFESVEYNFLMEALKRNDWHKTKTAKELNIHKTTLYRKMRALNMKIIKHES